MHVVWPSPYNPGASPEMCAPGSALCPPAAAFLAVNCWLRPPTGARMTEAWGRHLSAWMQ